MGEAHIVVGCGGSGIKTLKRLNALFSQDAFWRYRMARDVYYVIVDTDVSEMEKFQDSMERDLAGVHEKPYVLTISLAEGKESLQPLVQRHMVAPFAESVRPKKEGRGRLLEHWWNRGPEAPFVAPNVTAVTDGAGQCPPVSYFLTWEAMPVIEKRFNELIEAMQRRQQGFGSKDRLNFLVVSGLAGGTGRGCWELVAFKLREMFRKYERTPKPRAFLYDASIFSDIYEFHPKQEVPMRVNALTGFSQLSCWVENRLQTLKEPAKGYAYRLPSFTNPDKPAADVLAAEFHHDLNNAAPVNHAYVVFAENGVSQLGDCTQYFEMVGAGLYAALSKSSIDSSEINSNEAYVGLASASFEVQAATLRNFFESQARVRTVTQLMQPIPVAIDDKVAAFFQRTHLRIDVTGKDRRLYSASTAGDALLLQRVLARLLEKSRNNIGAVQQAMQQDNVRLTLDRVRATVEPSGIETLLRDCFDEVIAEQKLDPGTVASELAEELFNATGSVSSVAEFIKEVQEGLDEEIEELPADMAWSSERENPNVLVKLYSSRPLPFVTRHFNDVEQSHLLNVLKAGIAKANYPAIKKELAKRYTEWRNGIDRIRENADGMQECFRRLKVKFEGERERTVAEHGKAFDCLFIDPNSPENPLSRYEARMFYHRVLLPVMTPGRVEELLEDVCRPGKQLFEAAFAGLREKGSFAGAEGADLRARVKDRLEKAIRESVGLPDMFIQDHFSLRTVVQELMQAWNARLSKAGINQSDRHHLEGKFEEFFGFKPRRENSEYVFPAIDDCLLLMAASLARTCKPYWMLHDDKGSKFRVTVFVPTDMKPATAREKVEKLVADSNVAVEFISEQVPKEGQAAETSANPYILLAFSTQGTQEISNIKSLDYYNREGVLDLVRAAESDDGHTIFHGGNNGGLGYADPIFIKNPVLREMRWKPWLKDDQAVAAAQDNSVADALVYALFPGDNPSTERLKSIQAGLANFGWPLPLFQHKGKNRYVLTRLPLSLVDGKPHPDHLAPEAWDIGQPVGVDAGLAHVWNALAEIGKDSKPGWRERILQESEVFWEQVLLQLNLAEKTPNFRAMIDDYIAWISESSRNEDAEDNKKVWKTLLKRASELAQR